MPLKLPRCLLRPPVFEGAAVAVPRFRRQAVGIASLSLAAAALTGCGGLLSSLVPDVYLVDRHTVTEADAAGEWPELEQRLRGEIDIGPQPFADTDGVLLQPAALRVLNDEFVAPGDAAQR